MPAGYMDAWLQVGKNYGDMIKSVGTSVAGGIGAHQEGQMAKESAPTMFSQYSQTAQAAGMQPDASIVERYSKLGEMSGPQAIQFNKDIMGAQQMQMNIANMQRQQQAYQMQQQAMQRAAQAQDLSTRRSNIINVLGGASNYQPAMPQGTGQLPTINPLFPTY